MACFDDAEVLLERLHHTFKASDESGASRAVLRAYTPGTSVGHVQDGFAHSYDSGEVAASYPKSFAPSIKQDSPSAGEPVEEEETIKTVKFHAQKSVPLSAAPVRRWSAQEIRSIWPGAGSPTSPATVASAVPAATPAASSKIDAPPHTPSVSEYVPSSPATTVATATSELHTTHSSALSRIIRQNAKMSANPYAKDYAQFSGEGLSSRKASPLKVWLPFSENPSLPMDVRVASTATVRQAIGYILFCYTEDTRRRPSVKAQPEEFELRMAEDDGEPDLDLPAFPPKESIGKFHFDNVCLCKTSTHKDDTQERTAYIRVHHAESGSTILKRAELTTVLQVLQATLKRRGLRRGEYVLERRGEPGVVLDPKQTIEDLEQMAHGPVEFVLIRQHSKRKDMAEDGPLERSMAATGTGAAQVENSLTLNQAKTYFVTKHGKYTTSNVEFRVDSDNIVILFWLARPGILGKQKRLVIDMENIVLCQIDERRPRFVRLCFYLDPDWKDQLYEARDEETARDIVSKINSILTYKIGGKRTMLQQRWEARQAGKK